MSKLHELLAVENDLYHTQKKLSDDAINTFTKKTHLFFGFEKRLENFNEGLPDAPSDRQEITTTVADRLAYVNHFTAQYFDAILQKEATNQTAKADLIIESKTIARDIPVTFLLGLETRLKSVRDLYAAIPTLPSGTRWIEYATLGDNIFQAAMAEKKYRTAKTFKHKVLYDATDKHPAQIEKWEENENIGMYITDKWSGLISPALKGEYLERIDILIAAVKKARQRGNNAEVVKRRISDRFFNYIMNGDFEPAIAVD